MLDTVSEADFISMAQERYENAAKEAAERKLHNERRNCVDEDRSGLYVLNAEDEVVITTPLFAHNGPLGGFPKKKINDYDWGGVGVCGLLRVVLWPKHPGGADRVHEFGHGSHIEFCGAYKFTIVDKAQGIRLTLSRDFKRQAWSLDSFLRLGQPYTGQRPERKRNAPVI